MVTFYFCRFHLKLAHLTSGIVVSNDKFKDLFYQNYEWRDIIDNRFYIKINKITFIINFFLLDY